MEFRNAVASVRTSLANILDPPSRLRRAPRTEEQYLRATLDGRMINAAGQAPDTWARIVSTAGAPAGFVYRCHCGTSYPFPEQTIFEHLSEKDRPQCSNRGCHARHGAFDFAGDMRLRVANTSADDPQFKAFLDRFDGDITAADFVKNPDGQFWLRDDKRSLLFARMRQIPDRSLASQSDRPLIIPTDGPDFEAEYESYDPGKGSAGFGSGAGTSGDSYYQLPRSWQKKHEQRMLRHLEGCGIPTEVAGWKAEMEKREQDRKAIEERHANAGA